MKFTIKKEILLENLNYVSHAISTKNVIPVLAGIKFDLTDEGLYLVASDNEIDIPFTSLEDWYIIYQLIPNREFKVNLIEKYLTLNGIENPDLFKRALRGNLPLEIRSKIENVLSSHF